MSNPENAATPDQEVNWEKRFKDTQGAYTKSQQELKATMAKMEALEKLVQPKIELDPEQSRQLDDLKYSDPDAWRDKINSLEKEASQKQREVLDSASKQAAMEAEMDRRLHVLDEFNRANGLNISDETIQYDVPPRITKKLENGEVTFEEFLVDVKTYLETPKKIGDSNKTLEQPSLGKVGGNASPTKDAQEKDLVQTYSKLTF
jgi:hypothetical protein